jgi:hypothetical protein
MLNGFEKYTHDLTDAEKELVPVFMNGFKTKIGKQNAVTNKEIVSKLSRKYKISDARVRKIINYIRNENLIPGLVASSEGYYITRDPVDLKRYIESLDGREKAIRRIKQATINFLQKIQGGAQAELQMK